MEQTSSDNRRFSFLLITGVLVAALVIRLGLFVGIVGADDVSIASLALRVISDGPYVPFNHYSGRIGLVYPQAVIFALFGVGEWQFAFLPMLSSLGGVFLAYLIGSHYGGYKLGSLAAIILGLFPLDAYFSSQLMPGLPLGTVLALACYLLLKSKTSQAQATLLAVTAGLLWGLAYLIKVEAFFFSFVVLAMVLTRQITWRTFLWCCLSVGLIVAIEHMVYWLASGDPLLRLHVATAQGGGKATYEYSMTQLWVFPKSWFLTPYYFGLHYYLLFAAVVWAAWHRISGMAPMLAWVVVFLLWLQFGGNPFAEHYSVKSHLSRYCNMLNVPMAVLIAVLLSDISQKISRKIAVSFALLIVIVSFILIPFNQLSSERQIATKKLLDTVQKRQLYPLYLDRVSFSLASMYLYDADQEKLLHSLQEHDFKNRNTQLTPVEDISGYVLINRGFVDYGYNRYRVDKVTPEDFSGRFKILQEVNNPGSWISYRCARFLGWAAGMIPLENFRKKIQLTTQDLLQGHDAVLMQPDNSEQIKDKT